MVGAAYYGYTNGDPYKLISPIDYNKNLCGLTVGFEQHPFLFYPAPNPLNAKQTYSNPVCVTACPIDVALNTFCKIDPKCLACSGDCADCADNAYTECPFAYPSIAYVGTKHCMPDLTNSLITEIGTSVASSIKATVVATMDSYGITNYMGDLYKAWWTFLACIGISFVYCFIYMFLIKCCASVMVWTTLILIALLVGGGGYYLWNRKDRYELNSQ